MNALPASEVRRRGDRMRRRNTALATVGGVVAAAVFIGTPIALMSGNDDDVVQPAPQPTPAPSVTDDPQPEWLTEIPDAFPLGSGFPETNGLDGSPTEVVDNPTLQVVGFCGVAWPEVEPVDSAGIYYEGESENSSHRQLILLPDEQSAHVSLTTLREAVQACPNQPTEGGDSVFESTLVDVDLGTDEAIAVAQQVREDDGSLSQLTLVQVARTANVVYVETAYTSAAGPQVIQTESTRLRENSAEVLAAMCVFAEGGCG